MACDRNCNSRLVKGIKGKKSGTRIWDRGLNIQPIFGRTKDFGGFVRQKGLFFRPFILR
jgi:hypothetical protein